MAGTLEVREDLCWMPAGWGFDHVLERIAEVLYPQDAALAERLLASRPADGTRGLQGGALLSAAPWRPV